MKIIWLSTLFSCLCIAATPEMPFTIVENRGQAHSSARLVGRGPGILVEFSEQSVLLGTGDSSVRIDFLEANPGSTPEPEGNSGATINFLTGADSSQER